MTREGAASVGRQVALSPPEDRTSAPGLLAAAFPTVKDRREAVRTAPRESQTTNSVEAGRARRQGLPMTRISGTKTARRKPRERAPGIMKSRGNQGRGQEKKSQRGEAKSLRVVSMSI